MTIPAGDRPMSPIARHRALQAIWQTGPGWRRLSAVNHNILGVRFMLVALVFFAIGGFLAMLIRAQLATSHSAFADAAAYSQIFTMHGTVMMFLFAIPMLEGLAIYLLPKLLGARDMAFPRLTAYGFWCYVFGGSLLIVSMLLGLAPDSGWFMYTPLSSQPYSPGPNADFWLLGITFVEISALLAAIEILVSILKMRAPGMSLDRMPVFGWYMLVTAAMMLVGFPPLILGSILLEMERAFGLPFFDPTRGGDPLLWQHLFWLFGHPEVYIILLPAAGALSTIIPTFARRPLVGYRIIVAALVAMGFLSFGLWVHHMFTTVIPHMALGLFSAASALVTIPTAIQIYAWIATLAHGRPRFDVPMLYVIGFFVIFVIGGMTGVMLAMVPFNWQAHDTHFVVAHLHYVLIGGFVFPMLAAVYYWMPHITGRIPRYRLSKPAFWLSFLGVNITFLPMHLTGLMGMPRRIHAYPGNFGWDVLNLVSSIGGFVTAIGFAMVAFDLILQVRIGRRFRRNPWQAATLEWAMPTPPAQYTFASIPAIAERADRLDPAALGPSLAAGQGYLGFPRANRQETLGVDPVTGRIESLIVLPRRSYLPIVTAATTALVFVGLLTKVYWLAVLGLVLSTALFFVWTRELGAREDSPPLDIGRGEVAPLDDQTPRPLSWWGTVLGLAGNAAVFTSLLYAALFLAVVAPLWPAPDHDRQVLTAALAVALLLLGAFARRRALSVDRAAIWLPVSALAHLGATATLFILAIGVPAPATHAYGAVSMAVWIYCLVQSAVATLLSFYAWWRLRTGMISAQRSVDLRIGWLWSAYAAAASILGAAVLFVAPELAGTLR